MNKRKITFNDSELEWEPLKKGGTSFKTHKLVEINSQRLEYKATSGYKIFALTFLLVGVVVPFFFFIIEGFSVMVSVIGLLFMGAGGSIFIKALKPIVFDKDVGFFWKGKKNPRKVVDINEIKIAVKLDLIYAIQVIKEYIKTEKSSYYSYEINLVLLSGKRIHVIDYGNMTSIIGDASHLSKFLGVRVLNSPKVEM